MGYFSNGTEGMYYQERYCNRCWHDRNQDCPIWLAHLTHNYKECNNPESILHMLIPRDGIENKECKLFAESSKVYHGTLPERLREWANKNGVIEVKPKV